MSDQVWSPRRPQRARAALERAGGVLPEFDVRVTRSHCYVEFWKALLLVKLRESPPDVIHRCLEHVLIDLTLYDTMERLVHYVVRRRDSCTFMCKSMIEDH